MSQTQKPNLRRKAQIPEEDRTDARDIAAEVIEDMWPATLGEIADASGDYDRAPEDGFSVSHIHNTLNKYFERYSEYDNGSNGQQSQAKAANDSGAQSTNSNTNRQSPPAPKEEVAERRHEIDVPDIYFNDPDMLQAYLHGWGDGFIDCRHEYTESDEVTNDGGQGGNGNGE